MAAPGLLQRRARRQLGRGHRSGGWSSSSAARTTTTASTTAACSIWRFSPTCGRGTAETAEALIDALGRRADVPCLERGSPSPGEAPAIRREFYGAPTSRSSGNEVTMCRWMAYSGDPILAEDLLFRPTHSIIDQSLHAELGAASPRTVTASASAGTATRPRRRRCTRAPTPPGTTRTCARSPRRSARRCCSRTCAPPAERRCNAATATRSATAAGCGCTTGRSPDSPEVKRDLMMAVDPSLYPADRGIHRHRDPVLPGPHLRLDRGPARRGRPRGRAGRRRRPPSRRRVPGPHDRGDQRRRIDLDLPLLQREEHQFAVLLDRHRPGARSCIRSWRSSNELGADTRFIVSEPLRDLPGAWNEVPEGSWALVRGASTRSSRSSRWSPREPGTATSAEPRCTPRGGRSE